MLLISYIGHSGDTMFKEGVCFKAVPYQSILLVKYLIFIFSKLVFTLNHKRNSIYKTLSKYDPVLVPKLELTFTLQITFTATAVVLFYNVHF